MFRTRRRPRGEAPAHVTETVEDVIREGEPTAPATVQQADMDALVARGGGED